MMEKEYFDQIREELCASTPGVASGKMMHAEAIHFKGKVFAFFSKENKMVFKLGKDFDAEGASKDITVFSPFKNKKPLGGWFEVPFTKKDLWKPLADTALEQMTN